MRRHELITPLDEVVEERHRLSDDAAERVVAGVVHVGEEDCAVEPTLLRNTVSSPAIAPWATQRVHRVRLCVERVPVTRRPIAVCPVAQLQLASVPTASTPRPIAHSELDSVKVPVGTLDKQDRVRE
jgi:hypothetical protein